MLALCGDHDIGALIRSPLGMGLLTGKFSADTVFPEDDIRHGGDLKDGRLADMLQGVEAIREILTSGGRTLAQGALAWIWAQSDRTIPIPGLRTAAQVEENAGAMAHGSLSEDQVSEIEEILARNSAG